jgi:hypothetical protein
MWHSLVKSVSTSLLKTITQNLCGANTLLLGDIEQTCRRRLLMLQLSLDLLSCSEMN